MNTWWENVLNSLAIWKTKSGKRCCSNIRSNKSKRDKSRRYTSISNLTTPKSPLPQTHRLILTNPKSLVLVAFERNNINQRGKKSELLLIQKIYISTHSQFFHHMFTDEHLSDVRKVAWWLRGHWNAGVYHAEKNRLCLSIFYMWLVRNGIKNLILLWRLENDRLRETYDTLKSWVVPWSCGTAIFFKRDTGIYDDSPYVDVE